MLGQAGDGNTAKEAFDRDGILVFDPEIPDKTIDRAITEVELGPRSGWAKRRRRPTADVGRVTDAWASSQRQADRAGAGGARAPACVVRS